MQNFNWMHLSSFFDITSYLSKGHHDNLYKKYNFNMNIDTLHIQIYRKFRIKINLNFYRRTKPSSQYDKFKMIC